MAHRSLCALCVLLPLLLPLQVLPQDFNLEDALVDEDNKPLTPAPTKKQTAPSGGAGGDFNLEDLVSDTTTTKVPPKGFPRVPAGTKAPAKPKPKPGLFSDDDLSDVSKDDTYKPDNNNGKSKENTAEVGTIAGFASVVAMALVGAVSSYISYQKKKLCFSIQQSLNTDMLKAENPEAVVATEPQAQQTLLEPPNAEPQTEENAV
ncbi:CD99 antigen-like protein 2 isoform X2 [Oreochromis niloticus]|uniref:CD99 antigen-like protein 2 n=2 Tax=Oreochromis TaxID=8139 RepID=A0A669B212_ORENI|nr:CD99 antigen-like protein 2 isoform X2 [Oreochromis niloticus]XP_039465173.1 CD99 antigen-like protein 2 isoform X2 [Oreochromis aureus]